MFNYNDSNYYTHTNYIKFITHTYYIDSNYYTHILLQTITHTYYINSNYYTFLVDANFLLCSPYYKFISHTYHGNSLELCLHSKEIRTTSSSKPGSPTETMCTVVKW